MTNQWSSSIAALERSSIFRTKHFLISDLYFTFIKIQRKTHFLREFSRASNSIEVETHNDKLMPTKDAQKAKEI